MTFEGTNRRSRLRRFAAAAVVWLLAAGTLAAASGGLPRDASAGPDTVRKDRTYYETRGLAVWEVRTEEPLIALTFDDGPDPVSTREVLEVLREFDVRATFFVVGERVERFPSVVREVQRDGHEIANHTYSHPYFRKPTDKDIVRSEITRTNRLLTQMGIAPTRLFRPPGGIFDESLLYAAQEEAHTVVLWSWNQDPRDWKKPGASAIAQRVLSGARGGDIVLLHDFLGGPPNQTAQALRILLPKLQERGFRFVTVSELMRYRHHVVVEK